LPPGKAELGGMLLEKSSSSAGIPTLREATRRRTWAQRPPRTGQGRGLGVRWEKHFVLHMDQ